MQREGPERDEERRRSLLEAYGRTLAYVYTDPDKDGMYDHLFVEDLIRLGYARTTTFPHTHRTDFEKLQEEAIQRNEGLWEACPALDEKFIDALRVSVERTTARVSETGTYHTEPVYLMMWSRFRRRGGCIFGSDGGRYGQPILRDTNTSSPAGAWV